MKKIEDHAEVEILILGNLLLVVGGIAGAFGLTALATGGWALALVGITMFVLGAVWLIRAFKTYQWDDLKLLWHTTVSLARESAEAKHNG